MARKEMWRSPIRGAAASLEARAASPQQPTLPTQENSGDSYKNTPHSFSSCCCPHDQTTALKRRSLTHQAYHLAARNNVTMTDENTKPTEEEQTTVDESPIAPADRRNSLEKHLAARPERSELIESQNPFSVASTSLCCLFWTNMPSLLPENILPASTVAPGLLAHQKEVLGPRRPSIPSCSIADFSFQSSRNPCAPIP